MPPTLIKGPPIIIPPPVSNDKSNAGDNKKPNTYNRIIQILKFKGMDSQQYEKACYEIKNLIDTD